MKSTLNSLSQSMPPRIDTSEYRLIDLQYSIVISGTSLVSTNQKSFSKIERMIRVTFMPITVLLLRERRDSFAPRYTVDTRTVLYNNPSFEGPNESTYNDFWWMIWHEEVEFIAMLCNFIEMNKPKVRLPS